jgi:1-deoxy-D-xylulose 5-phosphate reductoisomerase
MKRWLPGLLCMVLSGAALAAALAAAPDAASKRVQASMLVNGMIEVAPDGSVAQYALDHPEKLPPAVKGLLAKAIPTWKFEPVAVDGKPMIAKAAMSLRIVAKPLGDGNYSIAVAATHFGDRNNDQAIKSVQRRPPAYPPATIRERVTGTVYLALRVDAAGKVADAAAEQVDLGEIGSDPQMKQWRDRLAWVSVATARRWTFSPATDAASPYRVVRVPVTFNLRVNGYSTRVGYGQWNVYVPGPVQLIPWLDNKLMSGGVDALPDGDIDQVGHGLRLLTPIKGA